jgi:hypothetical protein
MDGEPSPSLLVDRADDGTAKIRCSRCLESSTRRRIPGTEATQTPAPETDSARAVRIATETTIASAKGELASAMGYLEGKARQVGEAAELVGRIGEWLRKIRS